MTLTEINKKIEKLKWEYGKHELKEESVKPNPFEQFVAWFSEALQSSLHDPSAMVLATVDEKGLPDTRVVLLKQLEDNRFIFFSHYGSKKAKELALHNVAALNFYWPASIRQIRIRGRVEKTDRAQSESYFATRVREAQIGAHAWVQSSVFSSREELLNRLKSTTTKMYDKEVSCPESWGGYALVPFEYEFFQGRMWRMHDRLLYTLAGDQWKMERLAP